MEIKINNASYVVKKGSSETKYFKDINLNINKGEIIGILGDKLTSLGNVLSVIKKPTSGEIIFDKNILKKSSKLSDFKEIKKKIGFLNEESSYHFDEVTIKDYISNVIVKYGKNSNINKKVSDSLRLVGLNDKYIDRNPNELSLTEQKKVLLSAILSYNPDVIILENFNKGLTFRDCDSFKKLFLKLKNKLNKSIVLINNNIEFCFDLVDKFYVINNGYLVYEGDNKSFYDDDIYKYIEMPKIVEFTKYSNSENHNILRYTDIKELIKEIYRKV